MCAVEGDVPWNKVKLYKRTNITFTYDDFELSENNTIPHNKLDDENRITSYREKINEYEAKLENGKNWEYYKKVVNPYELVYTQKKYTNFPESICIKHPLSRSYFKMIEILQIFNFMDCFKTKYIRTGHVCEGPGGFIEAIYEDAFKHNKKIQTTLAMTLKPKQKNIPGWKNTTHFLNKNKTVKVTYGEDDTGNILLPENQEYFIEHTEKVHIFTADGGFDFSMDYYKQEELIFPLLISSIRIAFNTLKKGGMFVIKFFDFYHKYTTDIIYILSIFFNEWTLYKPSTSRPCNPEHYFIGKGFIGSDDTVNDVLLLWVHLLQSNTLSQLYKKQYTEDFNTILTEIRNNSFKTQVQYLEKVFNVIENDSKHNSQIVTEYLKKNEKISYEWCMNFKMPIYSSRGYLIEGLQNGQQVFSR